MNTTGREWWGIYKHNISRAPALAHAPTKVNRTKLFKWQSSKTIEIKSNSKKKKKRMFTLPIPFMTSFAIQTDLQVLVTFTFSLYLVLFSFLSVNCCIGLSYLVIIISSFFSLTSKCYSPHTKLPTFHKIASNIVKFAYEIRYFFNTSINYA